MNNKQEPREPLPAPSGSASGWAVETMRMINKLTMNIKGKAFDPDWFMLRQRLEEAERIMLVSEPNDKAQGRRADEA